MNKVVRRKLEMAVRVRGFSRAHPSADASYASVLARLEDRIARMDTLSQQQQGGYLSRRSSVLRRQQLRRNLHQGLLRHLVTVAEAAAKEAPGLAGDFRLPPSNATHEAFRTLARKMLEQGQAERDLLARHGLADRLPEDLAAAVAEFDASVEESNEGRRGHVGARAELDAVSDEVMQLVEVLDGLNRYRYLGNPELLAEWESARHVVTGPQAGEKEEPPAAPAVESAA
jgi:hypothetical protein